MDDWDLTNDERVAFAAYLVIHNIDIDTYNATREEARIRCKYENPK
jgi:DNA-directed RNA polymerase subunit L